MHSGIAREKQTNKQTTKKKNQQKHLQQACLRESDGFNSTWTKLSVSPRWRTHTENISTDLKTAEVKLNFDWVTVNFNNWESNSWLTHTPSRTLSHTKVSRNYRDISMVISIVGSIFCLSKSLPWPTCLLPHQFSRTGLLYGLFGLKKKRKVSLLLATHWIIFKSPVSTVIF